MFNEFSSYYEILCSNFSPLQRFFPLDAAQALNKILDSDDEDLGDLSDSSSRASSTCTHSSKASNSSGVTRLKDKEKDTENSETKVRRKSCVPSLTENPREPPLITRITRNSIKTQPAQSTRDVCATKSGVATHTKRMTVKLEKIETSVFDFNSGDKNSDTPLSFVTRSGRKAKKTNSKVAKREPENDPDDDGDEDYKHVEGDGESESESESESEQSVNNESENNNRSFGSDFEVKRCDLLT